MPSLSASNGMSCSIFVAWNRSSAALTRPIVATCHGGARGGQGHSGRGGRATKHDTCGRTSFGWHPALHGPTASALCS
eukprot:14294464-Alexandrium_andersonii.AAC.1